MTHLNRKDTRDVITAVATIFTLAIMTASIMATTTTAPAAATTATTTTTTTSPEEAGMLELSAEPVYREQLINMSETPINQTHVQIGFSGTGTITLPNTTETISTSSTGSTLAALDGTAVGQEVITTEDGSESVTAKFFGVTRFGMEEGRGILICLFDTDSTGRLAPLDGMILAGPIEFPPEETTAPFLTMWEWQSGIPLPTGTTTATTPEESPLMDDTTTTTTTNATTTDAVADTDAATATTATPEEEVGAEGEEQQQQQTTTTIPPAPNPLLE